MAAVVVDRGEHWKALLMLAPVCLPYQTYSLFIARLEDQKRHLDQMTLFAEGTGDIARARAARRGPARRRPID